MAMRKITSHLLTVQRFKSNLVLRQASFTDENVEKFRRLFKSLDSEAGRYDTVVPTLRASFLSFKT